MQIAYLFSFFFLLLPSVSRRLKLSQVVCEVGHQLSVARMQQVSVYGCSRVREQFCSWVCFLRYWLPHTTPKCLSLLRTRVQALPRGFQSFHTSGLMASSFSSVLWASTTVEVSLREAALSSAASAILPVIFTSIWNIREPTGYLRFVATPWNQWREKSLGQLRF